MKAYKAKVDGPTRRAWDGYRCGKCGVEGHNARSCEGLEVESKHVAV